LDRHRNGLRRSVIRTPTALLAYYLPLFGLGIILLGIVFFSWLIDYYTRARVGTLMILTGIILLLIGHPINAIEMIVGGRMLILFGVIIYVAKLAIAYARAHETKNTPSF